jgi:hypothetical protein
MEANTKLVSKDKNIQRVLNFVLKQCEVDEQLAKRVALDNKTVDKMWGYITSEARKLAVSNTTIVDDATVYSWALHYFIESDTELKIETKKEKEVEPEVETESDESCDACATPKKVVVKAEGEQLKLDI